MKISAAMLVAGAALFAAAPAPAHAQVRAERIVLFGLPGVTWSDVELADTPNLDRLAAEGAVASAVVRSAGHRTNVVRGYVTIGAGRRATAPIDHRTHHALRTDERYLDSTAGQVSARRLGKRASGDIVYPSMAGLIRLNQETFWLATPGVLGTRLREAGVERAVVSAADLAVDADGMEMRRSVVLTLVDDTGSIDHGVLDGLLRPNPDVPFGVETDPGRFAGAVRRMLGTAGVVAVDPGETSRADEYQSLTFPEHGERIRREALERADVLLGRVADLLGPRDLLLVVAPMSPRGRGREALTPFLMHGAGVPPSTATSSSTHRPGLVTLLDLAPTIVESAGATSGEAGMTSPVRAVKSETAGRLDRLLEQDVQSEFYFAFSPFVTGTLVAGITLLAILAFIAFPTRNRKALELLVWASYGVLAVPIAGTLVHALRLQSLGIVPVAAAVLGGVAALVALARAVPGPRLTGGVVLLLAGTVLLLGDLLTGSNLQYNGPFGPSPIVAGRFYGVGNSGFAILISSAILGLAGLAALRHHRVIPWWVGGAWVAVVLVIGAPAFGADFGGVLAGLPAVGLAFLMGRGRFRIGWTLALAAAAVVLVGVLAVADFMRPPDVRTHLGRFAGLLLTGQSDAAMVVVARKAEAAVNTLRLIRWTYFVPVAAAVLALLVYRPSGILHGFLRTHRILRAGLAGALVAGVAGFAVNDSGVVITALVLAHMTPFLALIGVDAAGPSGITFPGRAAGATSGRVMAAP